MSEAEAAHIKATADLTKAREDRAAHEGALKVLRESAAKLDLNAAREAVAQIESELNADPIVDPPVTEERLLELRNKADVERAALKISKSRSTRNEGPCNRWAAMCPGSDTKKR